MYTVRYTLYSVQCTIYTVCNFNIYTYLRMCKLRTIKSDESRSMSHSADIQALRSRRYRYLTARCYKIQGDGDGGSGRGWVFFGF